ncbi:hypothetical protein FHETE_6055 [Fusarium heterosporum]|uniref:Uncharacterized protein n=1 Tax=Fusarium heterosporum TaxID=42747 RepID=A0A8H5TBW6_FUSHE|nr:hypothetical protein FHETE_6055 [Fusarium heterosporum]
MSSPLSTYVFDEQNMTWITCDLCAGSFQRASYGCLALLHLQHANKEAVDYARPVMEPNYAPAAPPPPPPPKDDKPGHSRGSSNGFSVYGRRS